LDLGEFQTSPEPTVNMKYYLFTIMNNILSQDGIDLSIVWGFSFIFPPKKILPYLKKIITQLKTPLRTKINLYIPNLNFF